MFGDGPEASLDGLSEHDHFDSAEVSDKTRRIHAIGLERQEDTVEINAADYRCAAVVDLVTVIGRPGRYVYRKEFPVHVAPSRARRLLDAALCRSKSHEDILMFDKVFARRKRYSR